MRTFYTGSDIEDLAASGIRQLEIGPGVALTDAARELAETLGIALVTPGNSPTAKAAAPAIPAAPAKSSPPPSHPRGCQHGPLPDIKANRSGNAAGPVIEQLVEAVSALKKRGG